MRVNFRAVHSAIGLFKASRPARSTAHTTDTRARTTPRVDLVYPRAVPRHVLFHKRVYIPSPRYFQTAKRYMRGGPEHKRRLILVLHRTPYWSQCPRKPSRAPRISSTSGTTIECDSPLTELLAEKSLRLEMGMST